ncbi:MAG: hypothetical protein PHE60_00390 [Sulfurospirillaceae bacterium]|nr:hypothetical protein [Sulfurospirillaceae bacterium]
MLKKLTLIMTMIAMVSTMAFAQTATLQKTKKNTVHKQVKHVSAKPAKKQHIASKNTKKTKKKVKVA